MLKTLDKPLKGSFYAVRYIYNKQASLLYLEGLQVWTWLLNEAFLLDQKEKTVWTNPIRWDWIKSTDESKRKEQVIY